MYRVIAAGLLIAAAGTVLGFPAPKLPREAYHPYCLCVSDGMVLDYERTAGGTVERWHHRLKLTDRDKRGATFAVQSTIAGTPIPDRTLAWTSRSLEAVLAGGHKVILSQFSQGKQIGRQYVGTFDMFGASIAGEGQSAIYEPLGEEEVRVLAGRFVAQKFTRVRGKESATVWIARGPGVVKDEGVQDGVGYRLELKAWTPGK